MLRYNIRVIILYITVGKNLNYLNVHVVLFQLCSTMLRQRNLLQDYSRNNQSR